MKHLVVGLSYRTADVDLLGKTSVPAGELPEFLGSLTAQPSVAEAVVLSTCNRIEVYAAVQDPDVAAAEIITLLAGRAGVTSDEMLEHVYVRQEAEAVRHVFRVACGLDSLVMGDAQILGQLRDAYKAADEYGTAGSVSHQLFQATLRISKRVHTQTGIDRVSGTLISAALDFGFRHSGIVPSGASVLIIGTGAMGKLALATLRRAGAGRIAVANRSLENIEKLTALYGELVPVRLSELSEAILQADIVVSATSKEGFTVVPEMLDGALRLLIDLGMPRNIDPAIEKLPGVTLVGIAELGAELAAKEDSAAEVVTAAEAVVEAAEVMIDAEIADYLSSLRCRQVGPVLAALRDHANVIVVSELTKFAHKRAELSEKVHADISRIVHRVVQQLLHKPTVSARRLAAEPDGELYTELLRELFALEENLEEKPA